MISLTDLCIAKELYSKYGYKAVDVPHIIEEKYSNHTKPEGVPNLYHKDGLVYCASSEQSFIQMLDKGELGTGQFQSLAPCYRPEPKLSDNTCLVFLKLELISVGCEVGVIEMATTAMDVMTILGVSGIKIVETLEGLDLETSSGLELGSYGYRKTPNGIMYTYGTGAAFPRLHNAKNLKN